MGEFVIETRQLSRNFDSIQAVSDVNLNITPGEIYALIGPNGAGKTTLIKMIVGLLTPTSGSVFVGGADMMKNPVEAKRAD